MHSTSLVHHNKIDSVAERGDEGGGGSSMIIMDSVLCTGIMGKTRMLPSIVVRRDCIFKK